MGHRLSKIYTRTGDAGSTGLGDGSRVAKDAARVEAYGSVDELNAAIGVLAASALPSMEVPLGAWLAEIQHDLFDLGGELCIPGHEAMREDQVTQLEAWLDTLNAQLPPLKEFILRGGCPAAAQAHLACTVARRVERRMSSLHAAEPLNHAALAYVNRLSDLLFVMARALNRAAGVPDVLWQRGRG